MAMSKPTCRGSYAFGTACGHCERCAVDPMNPMYPANVVAARVEDNMPIAAADASRPTPVDRDHILQFFAAAYLPDRLRTVSEPFAQLAEQMFNTLPRNPERTVALRKLLEAKDAAVRSVVCT